MGSKARQGKARQIKPHESKHEAKGKATQRKAQRSTAKQIESKATQKQGRAGQSKTNSSKAKHMQGKRKKHTNARQLQMRSQFVQVLTDSSKLWQLVVAQISLEEPQITQSILK